MRIACVSQRGGGREVVSVELFHVEPGLWNNF